MQSSIQHAHCYLPANLAAVLEYNPALISPIVDAFYTRDPLDLKVLHSLLHVKQLC